MIQEILNKFPAYTNNYKIKDTDVYFLDGENLMLFEKLRDNVYRGHFFFVDKRGKAAKDFAKECVKRMFLENGASVLQGLTPEFEKAGRIMARLIGGKSYGIIETINGPAELFMLTKKEWESNGLSNRRK